MSLSVSSHAVRFIQCIVSLTVIGQACLKPKSMWSEQIPLIGMTHELFYSGGESPVWYKTKFGSQNLCMATKIGRQCYFLIPTLG